MGIYDELIGVCWLSLVVFWLSMAIGAKKTLRTGTWWIGASVRVAILVVIFVILRFPAARHLVPHPGYGFIFPGPLARAAGIALCACGVAMAIWARVFLGRNWGMPMSLKENPELVTGGPYALIRHPIYTGILAALLGSALADNGLLLVPFAIFCAYFIFSATREEKNMTRQFPDAYPDYKKRSWMLIPFVF